MDLPDNTSFEGEVSGTGCQFAIEGQNSNQDSIHFPGHHTDCPHHLGPPGHCWWCAAVTRPSSRQSHPSPRPTASAPHTIQNRQPQYRQEHQHVQGRAPPTGYTSPAIAQPVYGVNTPSSSGGHILPAAPTSAQPCPLSRALTYGTDRTYADAAQQPPPLGHAFPLPPSQGRTSPMSPRRAHSRLAEHDVVMLLSPDLRAEWRAGLQQQRIDLGMSQAELQQMVYAQQQARLQRPMDMVGNPRNPATWFERTPNRMEDFNVRQRQPQRLLPPSRLPRPVFPTPSTRSRSSASVRRQVTPATPNRSFRPSLSTPPTQSTTSRTQRTRSEMQQGTGPYQCDHPECGYRFPTQAALNKHVKNKHTPYEDRKHVCHVCEKRFVWENHLKKHLLTHVESLSPGSPSPERFFCECNGCPRSTKAFGRKDHLTRHMRAHRSGSSDMSISISSQR